MNKIYRVIWSKVRNCYVVVSEIAKAHSKGGSTACRVPHMGASLTSMLLASLLTTGYSMPVRAADPVIIEAGDTIQAGSGIVFTVATPEGGEGSNVITVSAEENETLNFLKKYMKFNATYPDSDPEKPDPVSAVDARSKSSFALGQGTIISVIPGEDKASVDNLAIGSSAKVYGNTAGSNTAIGANAVIGYYNSFNSTTDGIFTKLSTALGASARVYGDQGVAIGENSQVGKSKQVIINQVPQYNPVVRGVAIGSNAKAWSDSSTAIGPSAEAGTTFKNDYNYEEEGDVESVATTEATAVGYLAKAKAYNSTVLGVRAEATDKNSTAIGVKAKAATEKSTAIGAEAEASGKNSIAIGTVIVDDTTNKSTMIFAQGKYSTAIGAGAQAKNSNSTAIGASAQANNQNSTAIGANTKANQANSTAIGTSAKAFGQQSSAIGASTVATGRQNVAIGIGSEARKYETMALGFHAVAVHSESIAVGHDTATAGDSSLAIGHLAITGMPAKEGYHELTDTKYFMLPTNSRLSGDSKLYLQTSDGTVLLQESNSTTNGETEGTYYKVKAFPVDSEGNLAVDNQGNPVSGDQGTIADWRFEKVDVDGKPVSKTGKAAVKYKSSQSTDKDIRDPRFSSDKVKHIDYYYEIDKNNNEVEGTRTNPLDGGIAIGSYTVAQGEHSLAVGLTSAAYGKNSTAHGLYASAFGEGAIAFGHETVSGARVTIKKNANIEDAHTTEFWVSKDGITPRTLVDGSVAGLDKNSVYKINSSDSVPAAVEVNSIGEILKVNNNKFGFDKNKISLASDSSKAVSRDDATGNYYYTDKNGKKVQVGPDEKITFTDSDNGSIHVTVPAGKMTLSSGGIAFGSYSHAEGDRSVALGRAAGAYDKNSTAIGLFANAFGEGAMAIGHNTVAGAEVEEDGQGRSILKVSDTGTGIPVRNPEDDKVNVKGGIAIGSYAHALGDRAISVGRNSGAFGNNSTVFGLDSNAYGKDSMAFGHEAVVGVKGDLTEGQNSIAVGRKAEVTGSNSIAIGTINGTVDTTGNNNQTNVQTKVSGNHSIAVGAGSEVKGDNSIAIGTGHKVGGNNSGAFGDPNVVNADSSYVVGNNSNITEAGITDAFILGNNASVIKTGGVALGSYSEASREKSTGGFNPKTETTTYTDGTATWESTYAAVSVGKADGSVTRQITGVAAGTEDTDAVNVAQLKLARVEVKKGTNVTSVEADPQVTDHKAYIVNVDNLSYKANGKNETSTKSIALSDGLDFQDGKNTTTELEANGVVKINAYKSVVKKAEGETNITVTPTGPDSTMTTTYAVSVKDMHVKKGVASYGDKDTVTVTLTHNDDATATIEGLKNTYTTVTKDAPNKTVTFSRNDGIPDTVISLGDLGGSSTDYRLVGSGASYDAAYTVGDDGTVVLNVQDQMNPESVKKVTIKGLAPKKDVTHFYSVNSTDSTAGNYDNKGATGKNALAAGVNASATKENAIAIGNGATATGEGAIAIGSVSYGVGISSKAEGLGSIALGIGESESLGENSMVWGERNIAGEAADPDVNAANATAFGSYTTASGLNSTSFGSETTASGENATTWGDGTIASGNDTTAWGENTTASEGQATAFGTDTIAKGTVATAFGDSSISMGYASTAFGYATKAGRVYVDEEGDEVSTFGDTAFGWDTRAVGDVSTAFGYQADAAGSVSTAIGFGSKAYGDNSIAMLGGITGEGTIEEDDEIEDNTIVTINKNARGAMAVGEGANAQNSYTYAIGQKAVTSADNTLAFGNNASATKANSVALGSNSSTTEIGGMKELEINGKTYKFAGAPGEDNGTVSIGLAGKERTILNVAPGRISDSSTDAINGSQLYSAIDAMQFDIVAGDNVDVKMTVDANGHTVYTIHALNAIVEPGPSGNVTVDPKPGDGNGTEGQTAGTGAGAEGESAVTPTSNDHTTTYIVDAKDTTLVPSGNGLALTDTELSLTVEDTDKNKVTGAVKLSDLQKKIDTNTTYTIKAEPGEKGSNVVNEYTVTDSDGQKLKPVVDTDTQYNLSGEKGKPAEDGSTTYTISLKDNNGGEVQTAEVVDTNTTNKEIAVTGEAEKTVTLTDSDGNKIETSFKDLDTRNTVKAGDDSIKVETTPNEDGSVTYTLTAKAKASSDVEVKAGSDNIIVTPPDPGDDPKVYTVDVKTDGKVASGDSGIVTGDTVYKETRVEQDGNYIKKDNTAAENITALDEKVKDNSTRIDNINDQFNNTYNQMNRLDDRMKKGLAGAAALAALHPMDFNPDDKMQFSAGIGHYRGENAAAIGAFYRPDENVMFSIGGVIGNGDNMLNAGITFGLDGTRNRITRTRTAMAHEIVELKQHIARQDEQIAKLTELVNKLVGPEQQIANTAMSPDVPERELEPEQSRIYVERISGQDNDRKKAERVRAGQRP